MHDSRRFPKKLLPAADFVHVSADGSDGLDEFFIRRVGKVDQADLVVLAVAAAGGRLRSVLEPVRSDPVRVLQRAADVILVMLRPVGLRFAGNQPGVEHAAIQSAEMEFPDNARLVDALRQREVGNRSVIAVKADDVTVFGAGANRQVVSPREPAAQVQLVGGEFLNDLVNGLEVLLADNRIERPEVAARQGFIRDGLRFQQRVPAFVGRLPDAVEGVDAFSYSSSTPSFSALSRPM